jgi:hypothetical protein
MMIQQIDYSYLAYVQAVMYVAYAQAAASIAHA